MQGYSRIVERENTKLLVKPSMLEIRDFTSTNVDSFMKRGLKLAPNVDGSTHDTKEEVDKGILTAVQESKEVRNLLRMSPSFCAWF